MSFLSSSKERDNAGGDQTHNEPSEHTSENDEANQLPLGGGGRGHPRRHQQYRAPRLQHQHECCQCRYSVPQGEVYIGIVCGLYSYLHKRIDPSHFFFGPREPSPLCAEPTVE